MDAAQALGELMELSSQITAAVVLDGDGAVLASSSVDSTRAEALGAAIQELVAAAADLGAEGRDVTRVEVELDGGALFVVREGGHTRRRDDGARSDVRSRRLRPQNVRADDRPAGAEEATSA